MSIIQNIENFNAQILAYDIGLCKDFMYDNQSAGATIFEGRIYWILPVKLSFSLFLVKYSVLNLFLVLAHMQFPILDHYIHMSKHRKWSI